MAQQSFKPVPSIPNIPADTPKNLRPFLEAVRDAAITRHGLGKNQLDRSVTVRELRDLGIIAAQGSSLSISNSFGEVIEDSTNGSALDGSVGTLPDISGVNFSVNVLGVVIDWSIVLGANNDQIQYTEIWRVGPFDALDDGSYPAMSIAVDANGDPYVAFVDPINAVDDQGAPLPAPVVALSGIAEGFIYGEYIEPGKSYQYFLRYRGIDSSYTQWHSLSGTQVDAVVDYQAILDQLEGEIGLAQLDSTLADLISRIDINTGELVTLDQALDDFTLSTAAGFLNEADARNAAIATSIADREQRLQDIFDYVDVVDSALQGIVESRALIQDGTIAGFQTIINDNNTVLAAQVQAIVAASGFWYVQNAEPLINPYWESTYHWIDTNDDNKHYVSTEASRGATELFINPVEGAGWSSTVNVEGKTEYTHAGAAETDLIANLTAAGDYILYYEASLVTQGELAVLLDGVELARSSGDGPYEVAFTAAANDELAFRGLSSYDGTIVDVSIRPAAQRLGWQDITDTRIDANVAAITTEQSTRITADDALALDITNLTAQINNSTSGLSAIANAQQSFETYVLDQGAEGFLAESLLFTSVEAKADDALSNNVSNAEAQQLLEAYIANTGPDGYIQQTLFATTLGSDLANAINGGAVQQAAFDALETYINDQGPNGLLASSSKFTSLDTKVTTANENIVQNATAVSDLNTYVNNDGIGGLFQSSSRFTQLENKTNNLDDDIFANSQATETLDSYISNQSGTGYLANASYLNNLVASINSSKASVSEVNSAIATEQQARTAAIQEAVASIDGVNSAAYLNAAQLVATVDGKVTGRVTNKIDVNGRITGYEYWDSNGTLQSSSTFAINASVFYIRNPVTGAVPFAMNGNAIALNFDVINLAGLIPSANIGTIDVGKITGNTGNFVSSNIGTGVITSAKIASTITSTNWPSAGWKIWKSGRAEFKSIVARGDIQATSISANAANIISTLMLQGNAVTVPVGATGTNRTISPNTNNWNVCVASINPQGGKVQVQFTAHIYAAGDFSVILTIQQGSSVVATRKVQIRADNGTNVTTYMPICINWQSAAISSGTTFYVKAKYGGAHGGSTIQSGFMTLTGLKR